jgi:gliding motility-associated-like protein/uncharacterized repeat protein (TIGR01451 family)
MKKNLKHIIILIAFVAMALASFGQRTRYVQVHSTHALSVPEHDGYSFEWRIMYGNNFNSEMNVPSTTNVTHNIVWDQLTTYRVTVTPMLDSVGCYGEPVSLDVITVQFLSLHTFDDIFYTTRNVPFSGNVGDNDLDETGANVYFNPTPVFQPQNGTVELFPDGSFTYTPNNGFTGTDQFVYEAFNDHAIPMYSNATVTIIVQGQTTVADLHIEKTGKPKALLGGLMEYTINVKNLGPDLAQNVVVVDTMAFGLFRPTYSAGGEIQPWNGRLQIGNLAAGDSLVIYLFADISPNAPRFIYNQAITWSDTYDPYHPDNSSIWMTEISAIYVDLNDIYYLPSCETKEIDARAESNNSVRSYEWIPATGLNDPTILNPVFTPDETTIGMATQYVLLITDVRGNISSDTTTIIVAPEPLAIISGDTLFKDIDVNITINGDESFGDGLSYFWWSNHGGIIGYQNRDSIEINTTGWYHLRVVDEVGCEAFDSVLVLLQSHPPVTRPDSIAIVAGTSIVLPDLGAGYLTLANNPNLQRDYLEALPDSAVNVLLNDYDISNFDLRVGGVVTEPKHATYLWDENGIFTIRPNENYWGPDSIEYEVCNNGYPVQCSTDWIYINSLRPPLNADVVIEKTGDAVAFWGDTIRYNLAVYNLGPDTTSATTITDIFNTGLYNPEYSLDNGTTWLPWIDRIVYNSPILPNQDTLNISLRAYVRLTANRNIRNTAFIETAIIENELVNDTSSIVTKIKHRIEAIAGNDTIIGQCNPQLQLDASESSGENLTYRWQPSTHLSNPNIFNPVFTNPGLASRYIYTLTVTDDDGITSKDEIMITVLAAPIANAGPDRMLQEGKFVLLNGSGSSGTGLIYLWETTNGNIVPGTQMSQSAVVDSIGRYSLTVSDQAGCSDTDFVTVFNFFHKPFAIPDYYSISTAVPSITGNVLYNDFDPNGIYNLVATPGTYKSSGGGTVVINANGDFTYNRPAGFINNVDDFTYWVCAEGMQATHPNRCARGYARVTVNNQNNMANLNITKTAVRSGALIGDPGGVEFLLTVENLGPDNAASVWVTDSLSEYITNHQYRIGTGVWQSGWTGSVNIGAIPAGQSRNVSVRGTAASNAPSRVYNAATAASPIFDEEFNWDDAHFRNVDTASVTISSDLFALAELREMLPTDLQKTDYIIGPCDDVSYLTAENSRSILPIDSYEWSPRNLVTNPNAQKTTFTHALFDTTITFTLTISSGEDVAINTITVTFSPQVIADAGPDRKMNPGVPLVIDATRSQGANASFRWYMGAAEHTNFENENVLRPIISEPGVYMLIVDDMHGCFAIDDVTIKENDLYAVNDFMVMLVNETLHANVSTNDYDPDGDSIYYPGVVTSGPFYGTLQDNPTNKIGDDGSFIYVPNNNYVGADYFIYRVCDDNNPDLCVEGTVFINVLDIDLPNTPPVANPDYFFVNRDNNQRLNVLANDFDLDGDKVSLTRIINNPTKGTVSIDVTTGDIIYIPFDNQSGIDQFVYEIRDYGNPVMYSTATVTIYIHKLTDENQHPVAVDDAYFSVEKTIYGNVLINDYDPNGDEFHINIIPVKDPQNGFIRFNPDGSFEYTPNDGFEGTDQIVYQICETRTQEQYCDIATLYIISLSADRYSTDVAIEKSGSPFVISGTEVAFALTITIEGPTLANDIVIIDTLDARLTNAQYSFDEINWYVWNNSIIIDQMMLYSDTTVYIRAGVPVIFNGNLLNVAYVEHAMNETEPENNRSEVEIDVYQKLIANAGTDITIGTCEVPYQLDATASLGVPDMKYSWTPAGLLDDPNSATPMYSGEPETTVDFMLVVFSTLHPQIENDTAYVSITVDQEPIAEAGADFWPETADPVTLDGSNSTGVGPLSYLWWYYDDENNVVVVDSVAVTSIESTNDYYLTITDKYGCQNTDVMHVGYPVDEFVAVDDCMIITYQQEPVDIYVLRNDLIDDADEYNLDLFYALDYPLHGQLIANPYDSMFTYIPEMYYFGYDTFTYVVSTKFFNDQATVCIQVLPKIPFVPEGFSPNGDGINEFLLIEHIELYPNNSLIIFNRWGNIVYQKDRYDNSEPWDGIANKGVRIGKGALPTGVYFYILDLGDDRIPETVRVPKGNIYIATDNRR